MPPIQTERQGIFTDSVAVLSSVQRDATKLLISTANVVPGLPAAMVRGATPATGLQGQLNSVADATGGEEDLFYGVFINLPVNTLLGRTSLGEFEAKRATVELQARIIVRDARFQNTTGGETIIIPFDGALPTVADIGKKLHAVNVTDAAFAGGPNLLKWHIEGSTTGVTGFEDIAVLVGVSDNSPITEFEILIPAVIVNAAAFTA